MAWTHSNKLSIPFRQKPHVKSDKIAQTVLEKTFKNYTILYKYIAQREGQIIPRGQNVDCN